MLEATEHSFVMQVEIKDCSFSSGGGKSRAGWDLLYQAAQAHFETYPQLATSFEQEEVTSADTPCRGTLTLTFRRWKNSASNM